MQIRSVVKLTLVVALLLGSLAPMAVPAAQTSFSNPDSVSVADAAPAGTTAAFLSADADSDSDSDSGKGDSDTDTDSDTGKASPDSDSDTDSGSDSDSDSR